MPDTMIYFPGRADDGDREDHPFDVRVFLDECGIPAKSPLFRDMLLSAQCPDEALYEEEDEDEDENEDMRRERKRKWKREREHFKHLILIYCQMEGSWSVHLYTKAMRERGETPLEAIKLFDSSYAALKAVCKVVPEVLVRVVRDPENFAN